MVQHADIDHTGLTGVGGAGVTVSENFLTGAVTMTTSGTGYDGPSLTLAAGTYVLWGKVLQTTASAGTRCVAKLWDGTTVYDSSDQYLATSGGEVEVVVFATVVLGGSTTVKITCIQDSNAGTIQPTHITNATGATNKASHLLALKIA